MSFDKPIGFFVFDYAWILFILVTILNAVILKARSTRIVKKRPELQNGYNQLFKGYLVYLNIPWIVMGIGMTVGSVPTTFSYFAPRHGNLFVIAFHLSVIVLWLLSICWLYFKGGAEFLVKYQGVFNIAVQSPTFVKVYFGFCLLGSIFGMILMWSW